MDDIWIPPLTYESKREMDERMKKIRKKEKYERFWKRGLYFIVRYICCCFVWVCI